MKFLGILAVVLIVASGCDRQCAIDRVEWPVMGTVAAVQVRGGNCSSEVAKTVFAKVERLLNAHNPNSELSRLASLTDAEILAKCDVFVRPCYAEAFKLREQTGGLFNPRWKGASTMDLGAIAKGFAVDLADAESRKTDCEKSTLIDLGGNLKAVGGDWKVGIRDGESFTLHDGEACATSGKYFRGNHIKNGRTGGEVTNAIYSVTVIHPKSAMLADGLSTVLFIMGKERGEEFLQRNYPEAKACWIFRE